MTGCFVFAGALIGFAMAKISYAEPTWAALLLPATASLFVGAYQSFEHKRA